MTGVEHWTGVEIRYLRHARRMSVREFAHHLGVSSRTP
jgi:DNA-binding transcriptional regulator YiaG